MKQSIAKYCLSGNIYNKYDADKNLLLQFVNNEIPLIESREKKIHILCLEELLKEYTSRTEASGYYILDITGDGKKDFCVVIQPLIFIFTYDENTKFFQLWAVERSQQIPLENRQMFSCDVHTQTIWTHYFMNQNGEMIYSVSYQAEPYDYMESEGSWQVNYSITTGKQGEVTTEQVSQQAWTESVQELLHLAEQAPPLLQYDDLSVLSKDHKEIE